MNTEAQILIIKKMIALLTLAVSLLQNPMQPTQNPVRLGGLGVITPSTDYKIWYIKRYDDRKIFEVAVRFYEGAITTENERIGGAATATPITRYRRSRRLTKTDIPHIPERFIKDQGGADAKIYTDKDFGIITTNEELYQFLNIQLAKDQNRIPIDEEKNL